MLRVAIRVLPNSTRTQVGGVRGDALLVRVTPPPVNGKATQAALRALAKALDVRHRDVRLLAGGGSRDKVVAVEGEPDELRPRLRRLRGAS